jgi:hypothetical protein
VEWLECRLRRPGRVGPAEAFGLAGMADGMAAGVGWEVEALGMASGAATVLLTAGVSGVSVLKVYGPTAQEQVDSRSACPNAAELVRVKTCGSRGR